MSDTNPIYDLIELRESAKLSLADAAVLCGLNGTQSRKTLSDWELGKRTPKESRRTKFIGYLWDSLRLRDNPDEFERVWAILVERWGWDPISDGEWQSFTNTKRPASHYELRVDEKLNLILDRLPPASSIHSTIPLQKPLRTQHFTGRAQELAKLLEDLQPGKIVTLCGPGGMGKSALAAEAIWTLAPGDDPPDRFPDGIIFHTFYHQPQAGLALEAIARAYGVDPRPARATPPCRPSPASGRCSC